LFVGWVRTPDGELVQTRMGRSVSMASQAELSDIMAGIAQQRTVDERPAISHTRSFGTEPRQRKPAPSSSSSSSSSSSRARPTNDKGLFALLRQSLWLAAVCVCVFLFSRVCAVIDVDMLTLDKTAWSDVLAAFDDHRDLTNNNSDAGYVSTHCSPL
jgi:hypothetical protein